MSDDRDTPPEISPELRRKPVTFGMMHDFVSGVFDPVLKEIVSRLKAVEAREWQGTFDRDKQYERGALVTHHGSIWHANVETKGVVPGESNAFWSLAVKRGRDAKEAR